MLSADDPYLGFKGYFLICASAVISTAALLAWAWGRPLSQAVAILVGGTILSVGLFFASTNLTVWIADSRRDAHHAKQDEEYAKLYRSARAYYFENVTYDPQKNKMLTRVPREPWPSEHPVIVVPFGAAFILILQESNAWAFDGNTSTRVEFSGAISDGTTVTPGSFTFQGKRYSIEQIRFADMAYGRDHSGNGIFINPTLVDTIAPAPEIRQGKTS